MSDIKTKIDGSVFKEDRVQTIFDLSLNTFLDAVTNDDGVDLDNYFVVISLEQKPTQ